MVIFMHNKARLSSKYDRDNMDTHTRTCNRLSEQLHFDCSSGFPRVHIDLSCESVSYPLTRYPPTTSTTKVIIVGCGIAAPVLAIFLKLKGYEPVVYERLSEPTGLGLSLVSAFNRTLVRFAERHGVKIIWNHQLVSFEQHEDSVVVGFTNGATDNASFVIGCDGLHSNTRICLFREEKVNFTGLTQVAANTGGISPRPDSLVRQVMRNLVTQRESVAKETWRAMDEEAQKEFRENGPYSDWPFGGKELVKGAERITKYSLYDRPRLKTWYKGRVALLGDAAHPTSPHIGQGANQAFEDIYHLVRLPGKYTTSPSSTDTLQKVFSEYEATRIPRTSLLVKEAIKQGEGREVYGDEACKTRNDMTQAF
ncbi:FAD/NAD(P)-binding domain-containing protein [Obba rivulosa]|uniref:FAD/NAD(P)-binding domain-containing protein n=1 Tax=Obba rivulosa TaxID=1052685 RepID=A0A8E2DLP9_9APHY|nr:FAD/NAD(P)-binding domain-containing protein [Obba rivulosa]